MHTQVFHPASNEDGYVSVICHRERYLKELLAMGWFETADEAKVKPKEEELPTGGFYTEPSEDKLYTYPPFLAFCEAYGLPAEPPGKRRPADEMGSNLLSDNLLSDNLLKAPTVEELVIPGDGLVEPAMESCKPDEPEQLSKSQRKKLRLNK